MGEKNKNKGLWCCVYCNYKAKKEDLEDKGCVEHTKQGEVIECLKCGSLQFIEVK